MKRALTQREKIIALICLILVVLYGVYVGGIRPLAEQIDFLNAQILRKQTQVQKDQRVIHKAQQIDKEFKALSVTFKQEGTNEAVMSDILSEIESVSGNIGLKVSAIKPQKVKNNELYNHFSVSVSLEANLLELSEFLFILQNPPHLFSVDEIRVDQGPRRKETSLNVNCILSKFLIP